MQTMDERARELINTLWWIDCGEDEAMEGIAAALRAVEAETIERCREAQPATPANPHGTPYDRGFFDGVMVYAAAIRSMEKAP